MSAGLIKDASIWQLLGELAGRLDPHDYQVIDHWDADPCAIGIARADEAERLVYVSTYRQRPGHYAYECEEPRPEQEYEVARRADDVTIEELAGIIRWHLSMSRGSPDK